MPLAQSRLAPSTEAQGGPSTSSNVDDKSPETSHASSSAHDADVSVSRRELRSDSETEGFAQAGLLPSPHPCSESRPQPPLCHGETSLIPFDSKELSSLPDPMCPDLTIQLGFAVRDVVQTLPDDSLGSQAQLLQYIVQFIRTRGLRCTYWFKDRSLEELRAALTGDECFAAAVGRCAHRRYSKMYADSLFQVICHVCRRPPAHKSPKTVRFAECVQTIEAPQASYPDDPPEPPTLAPFAAADLERLHDPFSPDTMTHLMLESAFCVQEDDRDTEVHVVRRIFDVLLEKKLVVPNFLTELDMSGLREVLQRDEALWETLGSLRGLLVSRDTGSFCRDFTLIVRYLGRSMRSYSICES